MLQERRIILGERFAEVLQVKNWMTPSPYYVLEGELIREVAQKMEILRVDCLPMLDRYHQFLGMITIRKLLNSYVNGINGEQMASSILLRNITKISQNDSILQVYSLPFDHLPVVDDRGILVGVLTRRDILDGFSKYLYQLEQKQNSAEALEAILESAYEGIAVVDENGILQEFNEAYCRFIGIKREEAIGRHVTEVIENTQLHLTVKTGIPARGVLQTIHGEDMVVHRIPIWREGRVVGAIGMLIFEGVTEVYKIYEKLLENNHQKQSNKELLTLKQEKDSRLTLDQIIGTSEEISHVKRMARRAARTAATVLIMGESGTGKEMFAKSIHNLSPFSKGPFISVNCGAIPDNLFESELFGFDDGAFTGAKKGGKPGKFELANNGTIFLDEIGELPLIMQTKLLRVLQEKEVERVGGIKKYSINVRIIGATNRDLKEMVDKDQFREDLYYRLNIIQLVLPPLRERKKDIPILIAHYMKEICDRYQIKVKSLTQAAVTAFIDYSWRGNIRELVNTIERLVTLVDGQVIDLEHLPFPMKGPGAKKIEQRIPQIVAPTLIQEAKMEGSRKEKEMILKALKNAGGNKSKAAEILGIHRTTLYQKLKRHEIY
ncbi:sigma-54-dependent Fis family transcriptional regulator [Neobacillus mesonae]|uniref:Sigma-54-dependent Fis family transcriptional regulator n=2 Tax=Neobacillus mesonae TaxID=1193713 RepID=A0A3Q9QVB1_9BACI|nr:sigma-54-dependent Fis family transcriptional regulator [Neobacillus mesonae]